jgi:hypothetical protein
LEEWNGNVSHVASAFPPKVVVTPRPTAARCTEGRPIARGQAPSGGSGKKTPLRLPAAGEGVPIPFHVKREAWMDSGVGIEAEDVGDIEATGGTVLFLLQI